MGNRLTKIYTRTGDKGLTALSDGKRLSKSDLVFDVIGDVDELNAHIGMISAYITKLANKNISQSTSNNKALSESINQIETLKHNLNIIQHLLFNIGGQLSMPEFIGVTQQHIRWLEQNIDMLNHDLAPLKDFILPAGSILVSQVHIARTVCRRSERLAVKLKSTDSNSISPNILKFLNRLSDWLFVLSRYSAKIENSKEILWDKTILDDFKS